MKASLYISPTDSTSGNKKSAWEISDFLSTATGVGDMQDTYIIFIRNNFTVQNEICFQSHSLILFGERIKFYLHDIFYM